MLFAVNPRKKSAALSGIVRRIGLGSLAGFERIQGLHFRLLRVISRLRVLTFIEPLLGALQVGLGGFQVNRGLFSRPGLLRDGDRLPRITHFLHRRRRFTRCQ